MSARKPWGCFITGTDTGVGKTRVGTTLTRMLAAAGVDVQPRKPVETGCRRENGELIPADGKSYFDAAGAAVPLSVITPYRFAPAVAPARAARLAGATLDLPSLATAARQDAGTDSFLLVEGAGGFYSPLCADGSCADLARALRLPLLLVAADRVGCLNHILLTLEAIAHCKLSAVAVILNRIEAEQPPELNNAEDLLRLTRCPVFRIGRNPTPQQLEESLKPVMQLLV
jgi:dethiobiotin synthetase